MFNINQAIEYFIENQEEIIEEICYTVYYLCIFLKLLILMYLILDINKII